MRPTPVEEREEVGCGRERRGNATGATATQLTSQEAQELKEPFGIVPV